MYHISGTGVISLVVDSKPYNVQTDFPTYSLIRAAINNKDWAALPALLDVKTGVSHMSGGRLEIVGDDTVTYDGQPMHNAMSDRLLALVTGGFPMDSFFKFTENVMLNTSKSAVDELYLFLTKNDIPITDDGQILCYKKVDRNLKSIHASPDGTHLDHTPGTTVLMPRNQVDEDRNRTCSYGLHCCSRSYLPNYSGASGDRIVIVKVHPKDVVAIPSDYGNAKMRACQYYVVQEHKAGQDVSAFNRPVYKVTDAGMSDAMTNEELANAESRVREVVDSFFRRNSSYADITTVNYKESFVHHGIKKPPASRLDVGNRGRVSS